MADVISNLVPPALSDGGSPPGPVQIKYKDMGDGSYAPVIAVDASSIVAAVTTDTTLTGDGTAGDPLSAIGGIGTPQWMDFSARGPGFAAGASSFAPIALMGAVGAGGTTTPDPSNPASGELQYTCIMPKCTLTTMQIHLTTEPTVGESVQIRIRKNGAAAGPTITFVDAEVFKSDATSVTFADGDFACIEVVRSAGSNWGGCVGRVLRTPIP